ncbi:MAG: hypothetical protein WA323_05825 [Candidatus Nitrosopolaris sp.]
MVRTVGIPFDIRKYYYCKYLMFDIITISKSVDGLSEKRLRIEGFMNLRVVLQR